METNYQEQLKNWMNQWQQRFEDMRVQFSLGKMDAADAFEQQKSHMREAIVNLKSSLDKATDMSEEQLANLRTKMEELQVQLSLGKAEGMDMFYDQKKKIEQLMNEMKAESKAAYNRGFEQAIQLYDHQSTAFKTGLEIVQLQFALAKMDAKDEADNIRKELADKMNQMQSMMIEGQKLMLSQMEDWNKKWLDGMHNMQNWMSKWTK
jgi:hypothetical protein